MDNRRRHERHRVYYPISIDTHAKRERVGMARNTSVSGLMFGSPSQFDPGERVWLSFKVTNQQAEACITGTILRASQDPNGGWFSRTYAVRFDEEAPWLEGALTEAAPKQAYLR